MISILVPFTRPRFHARVLDMWGAQTYRDTELVFACNGPAHGFRASTGARYLDTPDGKSRALNAAIRAMKGNYACIWDDDDLYGPGYLEEVARRQSFGVTGLRVFDYMDETGEVRTVQAPGFQGGTLAFPKGMPWWDEGMRFCEEVVWRQALRARGIEIHAREPGQYTYCRYPEPDHQHAFPLHPDYHPGDPPCPNESPQPT